MSLAPPPTSSSTPRTTPPPPPGGPAPSRPPMPASKSSAKSHQSGTIEDHWNDLPTNFLPTSRSVSPMPPLASTTEGSFDALLEQLFSDATPSTLQLREKKMVHEKILKAIPTLTEDQKGTVAGVLTKVLGRQETPAWGRQRVVEFMMREKGVAGWAAALRRGVECIKWE